MNKVLIDGAWRDANTPGGSFLAFDPTTGEALSEEYPISSFADLEAALAAATRAVEEAPADRAQAVATFLNRYADLIEENAETLAPIAARETGLPEGPRLLGAEIPRTTGQLRGAAKAVSERSWCQATVDTDANIRSMLGPLAGPVVAFGPNNFPFAFNGISGGDFAAAIAAGNPVIAKAHPAHPTTSRRLAELALEALEGSGLPMAWVQLFYHCENADGLALVADRRVGAVAFTGSRRGGTALKEAADGAGIPISLEMSSINPVFVLPGALAARGDAIHEEFMVSCRMGGGQFCTNPGVVVVPNDEAGEALFKTTRETLADSPAGVHFSASGPTGAAAAVQSLVDAGAELVLGGSPANDEPGFRFQNTLLRTAADAFISDDAMQTEVFGTSSLFVFADDAEQMRAIADSLEGNLTGTIYSDESDEADYAQVEPALRRRVGRVINDKMPTGVIISSGMVHGGPSPATGHPGFTGVGFPGSLRRFCALHGYDNVPESRLPVELRDAGPAGMWRLVDGSWTQG